MLTTTFSLAAALVAISNAISLDVSLHGGEEEDVNLVYDPNFKPPEGYILD